MIFVVAKVFIQYKKVMWCENCDLLYTLNKSNYQVQVKFECNFSHQTPRFFIPRKLETFELKFGFRKVFLNFWANLPPKFESKNTTVWCKMSQN